MPAPERDLYGLAIAAHDAGRHGEAVHLLRQASQRGHVGAMSLLGAQLLSGRGAPPDPPTGARLIMEAAERGGGYACAVAASIVACGGLGPPQWDRALDYLQRSAELGHGVAQDQFKLLAGRKGLAGRESDWARLRQGVDLNAWRTPPETRTLLADPSIRVAEGFVSPAVCDWLVARARDRLEPAQVFDTSGVRPTQTHFRTNTVAAFDLVNADLVTLLVRERIAALAGATTGVMEAAQVFHYAVGQVFDRHIDFVENDVTASAPAQAKARWVRVTTVLVYLNEDFEGGETEFPLVDLRFRGKTGDALMFSNSDGQGGPDRRMLHAGLAPTSGEKWLLSQWIWGPAGPAAP